MYHRAFADGVKWGTGEAHGDQGQWEQWMLERIVIETEISANSLQPAIEKLCRSLRSLREAAQPFVDPTNAARIKKDAMIKVTVEQWKSLAALAGQGE